MTAAGANAAPADLEAASPLSGADASALEKNQVLSDSGIVAAFIELDLPTTRDSVGFTGRLNPQQRQQATRAADAIERAADGVVNALDGAEVLYTAVNGLAGVAVSVDAAQLDAIAARDDVVSIRPIVLKSPASNAGSNAFTHTVDAWQDLGATGDGQTIAVIDTGVDYSHSSFNADPDGTYPSTWAGNEAFFTADVSWPQGKVLGGWDFVGRDYTGGYTAAPAAPDANPMDEGEAICSGIPANISRGGGHGSHVAGTAAGWGVDADGDTYQGDYIEVDPSTFDDFEVGPGSAPDAQIVALKVFGCAGSTGYVGAALDWLLDPTNELAQQVTVVNLSVGSTFATADDPENELVDALMDAGKVVVISSGNSGDTFDIGGSPGNSNSALTVANSVGDTFVMEAANVRIGSATADETVYAGQYSIAYTFASTPLPPQEIVALTPGTLAYNSGCQAYSADDRTRVAGKTVVVAWNDNAGLPCGSAARAGNAYSAGATGIVFTAMNEVFSAGLTGDARIPTFQFTGPGTQALFNYAPATGVITLKQATWIGYDDTLSLRITADSVANTLNDSSSRGVHGSLGISKPDVAAPGTTITSVGVGTGNGTAVMSGTSMAAPHVAGIAAVAREAHPDFTAPQIKAAVMNTANHDVYIDEDVFGPQRVGSGRVDGHGAAATSVIAYDTENPDGVSVTFGVLEVSAATSLTRSVTVENHGDAAATLGVSYVPQTAVPGVSYTVSPASLSVAAGGSAQVTVTLAITDPEALAKTLDPSMFADQGLGVPREYLSIAQGWLELSGAPDVTGNLRVPVSAAPKPVSAVSTSQVVFPSRLATSSVLELTGTGLDQDGYFSIVAPFQLGASSPEIPGLTGSLTGGDLKAVGTAPYNYWVNSTTQRPEGGIAFGVSTWGPWATLGGSQGLEIVVENGNAGSPYTIGVQKYYDGADYYDTTIVGVWDRNGTNTGLEFINDQLGDVDTNSFDSAAVVLPVSLTSLGYSSSTRASQVSFDYSVYATSWVAEALTGDGDVDAIEDVTFDGATNLRFGNNAGPMFVGDPGTGIVVTRPVPTGTSTGTSTTGRVEVEPTGIDVLLLALHNGVGQQDTVVPTSDVIPTTPASQVFVDVTPTNVFYDDITWLYNQGITTGWELPNGDREFRPLANVARDAMAAFLYRAAGSPEFTPPAVSPFVDVATSNQFYKEITWLYSEGISTGWERADGSREYRPLASINRDAMAAFLYRYSVNEGLQGAAEFEAPATSAFLDVTPTTQFFKEISWLGETGISTGWAVTGGAEFRPVIPIARDAMAAFLYRLLAS